MYNKPCEVYFCLIFILQMNKNNRHTSYYRALLIIVHWSSLCLPCVNGPIFVTIREVHVPNINHVIFFWFVLINRIETGIL